MIAPRNIAETLRSKYTRYAINKMGINEEPLSGMGTFHATQSDAFCRMEEEERIRNIRINLARNRIVEAPIDYHQLESANMASKKKEPVLSNVAKESWCTPIKRLIDDALKKNLAWSELLDSSL